MNSPKDLAKLQQSDALEGVVNAYLQAKAELEAAEERVKGLRDTIVQTVEHMSPVEIGPWKLTVSEVTRENFSLAKAKEKLDGRILRPFITETTFKQLRVTAGGGK